MTSENNLPAPLFPGIRWIDSHCHVADKQFAEDLDAMLTRAAEAGVGKIIAVGDQITSSRETIALAERHPCLLATVGVHPHHASDWSRAAARELEELCRDTPRSATAQRAKMGNTNARPAEPELAEIRCPAARVVAVGETGLDFFYNRSPREAQEKAFLEQAEIARRYGLPLVVHCRDAYDLLIKLCRENDLGSIGGVVHCYGGSTEQAAALVDMGFHLGIAGPLTYRKNVSLPQVVRTAPLGALVLETDAPYLAPEPLRGRRNEPAFLPHTGAFLAALLGLAVRDVAEATYANTLALYRLAEPR